MSALTSPPSVFPEASTVTPKTIIAAGAVLPAVAAIAVSLRFHVRIAKTNSVGLDDYLILSALVYIASSLIQTTRLMFHVTDLRIDPHPLSRDHDDCRSAKHTFFNKWKAFIRLRAPRTGSAVHVLAQSKPLGDGPKGFLVVLNDALITAEKVNVLIHAEV